MKDFAAAYGLNRKEWRWVADVCPGTAAGSGRQVGAAVVITRLLYMPLTQDVSLNLSAP